MYQNFIKNKKRNLDTSTKKIVPRTPDEKKKAPVSASTSAPSAEVRVSTRKVNIHHEC